ncbi:hypothetical protein JW905_01395, partial [bacterium]|nr:hypothetical protein [candidate division CSSED10-310 bacterium]
PIPLLAILRILIADSPPVFCPANALRPLLDPQLGLVVTAPLLLIGLLAARPPLGSPLVGITALVFTCGAAMVVKADDLPWLLLGLMPVAVLHAAALLVKHRGLLISIPLAYSIIYFIAASWVIRITPSFTIGFTGLVNLLNGELVLRIPGEQSWNTLSPQVGMCILAFVVMALFICSIGFRRESPGKLSGAIAVSALVLAIGVGAVWYSNTHARQMSLLSEEARLNRQQPVLSLDLDPDNPVHGIRFLSNMSMSITTPQDELIAVLVMKLQGEITHLFEVRAGVDTAEWAYERPDVLPNIRHSRPLIAYSWPVGLMSGAYFSAHVYETTYELDWPAPVDEIEIRYTGSGNVELTVRGVIVWHGAPADSPRRNEGFRAALDTGRGKKHSVEKSDVDPRAGRLQTGRLQTGKLVEVIRMTEMLHGWVAAHRSLVPSYPAPSLAFAPTSGTATVRAIDAPRVLSVQRPILCVSLPDRQSVDSIQLISSLSNAAAIVQGTVVAEMVCEGTGTSCRRLLRAGYETAEWALGRPDLAGCPAHGKPRFSLGIPKCFDRVWILENRYVTLQVFSSPRSLERITVRLQPSSDDAGDLQLTIFDLSVYRA